MDATWVFIWALSVAATIVRRCWSGSGGGEPAEGIRSCSGGGGKYLVFNCCSHNIFSFMCDTYSWNALMRS